MGVFKKFGHSLDKTFGKHGHIVKAFNKTNDAVNKSLRKGGELDKVFGKNGVIENTTTKAGQFLEKQAPKILNTAADVSASLGAVAAASGIGLPLAAGLESASVGLRKGANVARAEGRSIGSIHKDAVDYRNQLGHNARRADELADPAFASKIQAMKPQAPSAPEPIFE